MAPAAWAGVTAVILVELTTVNDVAVVLLDFTDVAPVKSVPVIVTVLPPAVGPAFGETEVIAGTPAWSEIVSVTGFDHIPALFR
ncbi:MAG: hypothetical protein ABIN79_03745 [Marmoricola sp.]